MRLTPVAEMFPSHALWEVVNNRDALKRLASAVPEWPLPMMKYLIDRDAVDAFLRRAIATEEHAVEGGRLTLGMAWRGQMSTSLLNVC